MQFPFKIYMPFRLKLLLALLAAAGAAICLSYSGFKRGANSFSEQEAGGQLLARLDIAATVISAEVNSGLETARLIAAHPGLRAILASAAGQGAGDEKELSRRLAAEAVPGIDGLDLADAKGRLVASTGSSRAGTDTSRQNDFRMGIRGYRFSAPRSSGSSFIYCITVPVPGAGVKAARPAGALRCRFKPLPAQLAALGALRSGGALLALARRGGQKILIEEGNAPGRDLSLKAPEAAPFLAALEGKEGVASFREDGTGSYIYASRPIGAPDWILAVKAPFLPAAQSGAGLLERARINALLIFTFLTAASFFVVGSLTAPLRTIGREAGALLEVCGRPAAAADSLCEPDTLAAAVSEAASALKHQASRDLELETETEKLREEEADLKTQNDELEKLNKYLMEREIKISELKKEISELREKVGNASE